MVAGSLCLALDWMTCLLLWLILSMGWNTKMRWSGGTTSCQGQVPVVLYLFWKFWIFGVLSDLLLNGLHCLALSFATVVSSGPLMKLCEQNVHIFMHFMQLNSNPEKHWCCLILKQVLKLTYISNQCVTLSLSSLCTVSMYNVSNDVNVNFYEF